MTIEKVVGNDLSKEPFLPAKQQAHLPQRYSSEEHDVLVAYPLVHELVQQVLWWQVEEVVPPIQLLLAPQVLPPIHPDKNITYYSVIKHTYAQPRGQKCVPHRNQLRLQLV